jgi:hypothetical protein
MEMVIQRDAIGEGITVSRPVKTIPRSLHTFKIVEPEDPELEEWEFHSRSVVRCEARISKKKATCWQWRKFQTETVPARMLGEVRLAICDRLQPRPRALHLPSDRCVTS